MKATFLVRHRHIGRRSRAGGAPDELHSISADCRSGAVAALRVAISGVWYYTLEFFCTRFWVVTKGTKQRTCNQLYLKADRFKKRLLGGAECHSGGTGEKRKKKTKRNILVCWHRRLLLLKIFHVPPSSGSHLHGDSLKLLFPETLTNGSKSSGCNVKKKGYNALKVFFNLNVFDVLRR